MNTGRMPVGAKRRLRFRMEAALRKPSTQLSACSVRGTPSRSKPVRTTSHLHPNSVAAAAASAIPVRNSSYSDGAVWPQPGARTPLLAVMQTASRLLERIAVR